MVESVESVEALQRGIGQLRVAVREAFFGATLPAQRVTSLRRDEERSFRASAKRTTPGADT